MPEEITIKPREESVTPPGTPVAAPTPQQPTSSQEISSLVTLCAAGLLVGFFLPWVKFLGVHASGFDIQRLGDIHKLLWFIPACSGIVIIAGIAKQNRRTAAHAAGIMPYIALIYWINQLGSDLINMITYGGYLSLICGLGLLILPFRLR